ncbi:hypothetical protein BJV82DRAFT_667148 [Fennellomyces sp. T-0311]|nr:hypothetical protein BJV82DRAFT_667148 [Fennellomyces sp. T-0311]
MTIAKCVFFIGGTGNVGSAAVKPILKKGMPVTVFSQSCSKDQEKYETNPKLGVVNGNVNTLKEYEKPIVNRARSFLLASDMNGLSKAKILIMERAHATDVKQAADISAFESRLPCCGSPFEKVHIECKERIVKTSNRKARSAAQPTKSISSKVSFSNVSTKENSSVSETNSLDTEQIWISADDIGTFPAGRNILQDPAEKHDDGKYEMVGDAAAHNHHPTISNKIETLYLFYGKLYDLFL